MMTMEHMLTGVEDSPLSKKKKKKKDIDMHG